MGQIESGGLKAVGVARSSSEDYQMPRSQRDAAARSGAAREHEVEARHLETSLVTEIRVDMWLILHTLYSYIVLVHM